MGLIDSIRGFFTADTSVPVDISLERVQAIVGQSPSKLYETQPHLRTVVSFLASNVAQLPLKCYVRQADGDRPRDTTSVAARLIKAPNPSMTGFELIYNLVATLKLYDIAYWAVLPNPDADSGWEIRTISPTWVQQKSSSASWDEYDSITFTPPTGGTPITVRTPNLIIFHGYNPDDSRKGMSPVVALSEILAEQVSAWQFRRQVWERGGRFKAWISRPKDVQQWSPEQSKKWAEEFSQAWTGNQGTKAGGIPVLEDGMAINAIDFNSREAQWLEVSKLSLDTVASVYHLNPAMVGSTEGQTYASVKEYSRMLYTDTLGPDLRMIADRVNMKLLPLLGVPDNEYVEFDLQAKLNGSFEEQAQQIQSSVGAPWMTRNEARALQNLPRVDGGDELVTPLNVITGGMASPNDSDGVTPAYPYASNARAVAVKSGHTRLKARGHAEKAAADEMRDVLTAFFKRQRKSVLPKIGDAKSSKSQSDWWDGKRWNRELADDLEPVILKQATASGRRALSDIEIDPDEYDELRTVNYLRVLAEQRAKGINRTTLRQLQAAIGDDLDEDAIKSDPAGVFDVAETSRAESSGVSFATAVAGWAVLEACRQAAPSATTKTWVVTSGNPRPSHAMLDGETVSYDDTFSNGASWPGDTGALDVDEVAGCTCEVEITTP